MSLRINDVAPDFTAETTQGTIKFHDWIGDGWAILFSHPKNFTPVCTTELGTMAGLEGEFKKRNYIETYIPHLVIALKDILKLDEKEAQKARDNLTTVLEKSRKL